MLKRIYADNYRCLVNFTFQPQRMNLLVGDNGSGKTSLFEILNGIRNLLIRGHAAAEAFLTSTLTRWDTRDVQRFELDVEGNGGTYQYVLEIGHDRDRGEASIRKEELTFEGKPLYRAHDSTVSLYTDAYQPGPTFQYDPRRSFLGAVEAGPEDRKLTWFKEFVTKIRCIKLNPSVMLTESKKESAALAQDGSNFASWYRHVALEVPELVRLVNEDLKRIIDGFQTLRLIGGATKELFATCSAASRDARRTYDLSFDELSDGQRALVVLYSVLHTRAHEGRVLCFDEPDNFVALREIQPWLVKLSEAVEENRCQAMLISHHPEVIDYLAADSAFKFDRPTGDVVRVAPLEIDRDTGLKASELIARGWDDGKA